MALDIIKDIVDAEARAEEMIKNAEAEAASLKAGQKKKALLYLPRQSRKARKSLNAAADAAVKESSQAVEKIAEQAELNCRKNQTRGFR